MKRFKLIRAREQRNLTQMQVAELAKVGLRTYRDWEKGKATPHSSNVSALCNVLKITAGEIDLHDPQEEAEQQPQDVSRLSKFFNEDLTLRLFTAVSLARGNLSEIQKQVEIILQEFSGTDDARRSDALLRLGALSIAPFAITPNEASLNFHAASLITCQELGKRSADEAAFAFQGASASLQYLQSVINLVPGSCRKTAITMASQAGRLQQVLACHIESPEKSIQYAKQSVSFAKESDTQEHLMALDALAWANKATSIGMYSLSSLYDRDALNTMEEAITILRRHAKEIPSRIQAYLWNSLSVMQALNGVPNHDARIQAEKISSADRDYFFFVDNFNNVLVIDGAEAMIYQGDYMGALGELSQFVDSTSLQAKRRLTEREYIRILKGLLVLSLRASDKDMEYSIFIWQRFAQAIKKFRSERYFTEMRSAFGTMNTIWPNEHQVQALQPLTKHW